MKKPFYLFTEDIPEIAGAYAILNSWTSECYIGSSCNIRLRKFEHIRHLKRGRHHSKALLKDWKLNPGFFVFIILEQIDDRDRRLDIEQYWIDNTDSVYNSCPLSRSSQGYRQEESTKLKISLATKGVKKSEETKRRISEGQRGKTIPRTSVEKARKSLLEKYANGYIQPKTRPILQYDLAGNFIKEWPSMQHAGRDSGVSYTSIYLIVNGKTKKPKYFNWKFKN